jgi:hypothetical protein
MEMLASAEFGTNREKFGLIVVGRCCAVVGGASVGGAGRWTEGQSHGQVGGRCVCAWTNHAVKKGEKTLRVGLLVGYSQYSVLQFLFTDSGLLYAAYF